MGLFWEFRRRKNIRAIMVSFGENVDKCIMEEEEKGPRGVYISKVSRR
jgi:hypothetical protein